MSVELDYAGEIAVLKIVGDLTVENAEELRALSSECLKAGYRDFVVDLTTANSCDSAGLESLTWLQRQCEEQLGLVRLASLTDTFRKILEITRLDHRFEDNYDIA